MAPQRPTVHDLNEFSNLLHEVIDAAEEGPHFQQALDSYGDAWDRASLATKARFRAGLFRPRQ